MKVSILLFTFYVFVIRLFIAGVLDFSFHIPAQANE